MNYNYGDWGPLGVTGCTETIVAKLCLVPGTKIIQFWTNHSASIIQRTYKAVSRFQQRFAPERYRFHVKRGKPNAYIRLKWKILRNAYHTKSCINQFRIILYWSTGLSRRRCGVPLQYHQLHVNVFKRFFSRNYFKLIHTVCHFVTDIFLIIT